jgi:NAD(P)-dependent dehydrogenase (short-subunit alcohol dehydrogenase family)
MDKKKYIVIGGSSGIGLSIINQLTENGHQVLHFARNKGDWKHENLVSHSDFDVTAEKDPEFDAPEMVNGLVYCPGTINLKPFAQLTDDDFRNDFEINLLGAVRVIRHFYKLLRNGKPSGIVLFSTVAVKPGMAFHASISAAKGAVEGLTRSLAAEFSPFIRVNAIAPSLTDTRLASKILNSEEKKAASDKRHPLGRIGKPEDIASMAVYLLDDNAAWITGQVFGVDGGMGGTR